jgi:hypothetical protein
MRLRSSAQRDTTDMSMLISAADEVARLVAHGHDVLDEGAEAQPRLDELRREASRPAQPLQVGQRSRNTSSPRSVLRDRIAGLVPAVLHFASTLVLAAVVAEEGLPPRTCSSPIRADAPLQRGPLRDGRTSSGRRSPGRSARPGDRSAGRSRSSRRCCAAARRSRGTYGTRRAPSWPPQHGNAQPGQAQLVAQRAQHEGIGQRCSSRASGTGLPSSRATLTECPMRSPIRRCAGANRAGIQHVRLHGRRHALPLARREGHDLDREFADVLRTCSGPSGKFTTSGSAAAPCVMPKNCSVAHAGAM